MTNSSKQGKQMNVLCAIDNAYVPYCGVMLLSLFENNKDEAIHVYIICNDLSEDGKNELVKLGQQYGNEVSFINISQTLVENFPIKKGDHVSLSTYYRLFAPLILPKDIDKILYLDGDMIVDGAVKELYNMDIAGYAVAAALDEDYMSDEKYKRLGLESNTYFNAGVLLINLEYWRQNQVYERCMECIAEMSEKLLLHDQDTLNVVLRNEAKGIPLKYNLQTGMLKRRSILEEKIREEVLESTQHPVIIHYTGPKKPWIQHYHHPYVEYFRHYLNLSPWKDRALRLTLKEEYNYWRRSLFFSLRLKKYPYLIDKKTKSTH